MQMHGPNTGPFSTFFIKNKVNNTHCARTQDDHCNQPSLLCGEKKKGCNTANFPFGGFCHWQNFPTLCDSKQHLDCPTISSLADLELISRGSKWNDLVFFSSQHIEKVNKRGFILSFINWTNMFPKEKMLRLHVSCI